MSIKLTQPTRNAIRHSMLHSAFDKAALALMDEAQRLADDMWLDLNTAEVITAMDALPSGWLREADEFRVQVSGTVVNMTFNGRLHFEDFHISRPARWRRMQSQQRHAVLVVYDGSHAMAARHARLCAEHQDLKKRIKDASLQAGKVLASATTTGRLVAIWPECAPFVPARAAPSNLPAVPIAALNALLDLPVEARA